ncbi:MAG: cell division protein CrgA [Actinobacteria bacterium]|nr:cell division protein CrgA [Actinomycetota bacterium]MCB9390091.1 cell division protein CrgA [Acidimicrobiia bacterium]
MPVEKSKRSRYTPPKDRSVEHSPAWLPITAAVLLGLGTIIIIANYLNLLPGEAEPRNLYIGLLLITGGFLMLTRWR